MSRHYLDHASTSPLRPEAREALVHWLDERTADPARIHTEGHMARAAIEHGREQVASLLGARPRSVVFTSGATEAIVAACHGVPLTPERSSFALAQVEHSAVREASSRRGDVVVIPVDRVGRVDLDALSRAAGQAALVHLQWGNHEVGTLQPIAEAAEICRAAGTLLHVDAAQAAGHADIAFDELGVDLMSVSAHKMGGPPGIGALLIRRGLRIEPMLVGADQERARRAGFENLPAIMGFGASCEVLATDDTLAAEHREMARLSDRVAALSGTIRGVELLGDPTDRLPHITCLAVEGVEPQGVLVGLDQAGIAAHSGSSCASETIEPSPVLEAMGVDAQRSLRISVGWNSSDADVDALEQHLAPVVEGLRALTGNR